MLINKTPDVYDKVQVLGGMAIATRKFVTAATNRDALTTPGAVLGPGCRCSRRTAGVVLGVRSVLWADPSAGQGSAARSSRPTRS